MATDQQMYGELMTRSRDELLAQLPETVEVPSKATKDYLARLIISLRDDEEPVPAPLSILVRKIILKDGAGGITELDIISGEFSSVAMGRTIADGVKLEGEGDVLTINLDSLYLYGGDVIEWDPSPDAQPILLTLSTED